MDFILPKLYDADGDLQKQWYVFYYYKHPETRKMIRFRVFISKRLQTRSARHEKAIEIKNRLKRDLIQGFNPFVSSEKRNMPVVEGVEYVLELKSRFLKKRTVHSYNSIARHFCGWLIENNKHKAPPSMITKTTVEQYLDDCLINGGISNRTYNNKVSSMRSIWNFMLQRDMVDHNVWQKITYLPEAEPEITAYTPGELQLIKTHLVKENYQLYVVTQLIFYCYMRPAEIVRLQFRDLLWDHQLILFPGTKSKNKKTQVIVIPDEMKKNLKDWKLNYPQSWYVFSRNLLPGDIEIAPTRIAEVWRKFAGMHDISKNIYDFKHTGNGYAVDRGINLRDIQLQNRHHSLEQTQKYLDKFRKKTSSQFKKKFKGY